MTYTFNLVEQPWIPCLKADGSISLLSLREVLVQAHGLAGLAGDSPLETAALYRLLLAVLHSALRGPGSARVWAELWQAGSWDQPLVMSYLDKWASRFDLFDPDHPFYQAPDDRVRPKSIISLAMEMVSGNNATLFDHHTEDAPTLLEPRKAARMLLTAQTFGLAGLSGLKESKFTDAPWGRGIVFLIEGRNLFETLCLNFLRYGGDSPSGLGGGEEDRPAWELENPCSPDRMVPTGYLDYLTWQSRKILLLPQGNEREPVVGTMTIAPGLRLGAGVLDPQKHYRRDEQRGYLPLRFQEGRALWRDNAALFQLRGSGTQRPPLALEWVARLADEEYIDRSRSFSLLALGMANNQAKVEFFREEHMPVPLVYLERDDLVEGLANALSLAEQAYAGLAWATRWMAALVISPVSDGKQWPQVSDTVREEAMGLASHWGVDRSFWGQLELPFLALLEGLPTQPEPSAAEWQRTVMHAARAALEFGARQAGDGATALKAGVRARAFLAGSLKKLFPRSEKEMPV